MRELLVIGIGAGDADDITVRAVKALGRVDVVLLVAKSGEGRALIQLRRDVCDRYLRADARVVEIPDPEREGGTPDHRAAVGEWYERRARAWSEAITTHVAPGQVGAFLVWGDPALYDGTLRILDRLRASGADDLVVTVVPGISAVQLLTAAHGTTLNQVGGSVVITTGRELAGVWSTGADDVVVMLDSHCAFTRLDDPAATIYWGAYLGSPDEILIAGTIASCGRQIVEARASAKARKGWVFDTYLLRRARRP